MKWYELKARIKAAWYILRTGDYPYITSLRNGARLENMIVRGCSLVLNPNHTTHVLNNCFYGTSLNSGAAIKIIPRKCTEPNKHKLYHTLGKDCPCLW